MLADPAIYEHQNAPPLSAAALQARLKALESRRSPDGLSGWLNWVIRLNGESLIGFVQATVSADGEARIAYVVGSPWWGQGLATLAVKAMSEELVTQYDVNRLNAVLKQTNQRSLRLLQRMGFSRASDGAHRLHQVGADEMLTTKIVSFADSGYR